AALVVLPAWEFPCCFFAWPGGSPPFLAKPGGTPFFLPCSSSSLAQATVPHRAKITPIVVNLDERCFIGGRREQDCGHTSIDHRIGTSPTRHEPLEVRSPKSAEC